MRINVNLYPKGGHVFKNVDGVTIVGTTWDGVIARLRAYRKRNGQPEGDPAREVMAQACANNPGLCVDENQAYKSQLKVTTLKGRMLSWFMELKRERNREPLQFVDTLEAKRRSDICRGCPMNKEISEGCSSCRAALVELRKEFLGTGRAVDEGLVQHGCLVIGADLATQVHLDLRTIEHSELPQHCWRKRLI